MEETNPWLVCTSPTEALTTWKLSSIRCRRQLEQECWPGQLTCYVNNYHRSKMFCSRCHKHDNMNMYSWRCGSLLFEKKKEKNGKMVKKVYTQACHVSDTHSYCDNCIKQFPSCQRCRRFMCSHHQRDRQNDGIFFCCCGHASDVTTAQLSYYSVALADHLYPDLVKVTLKYVDPYVMYL